MSNTIITQQGINFVLSASTLGPFIHLKYFLPVYDYRADPNVHNNVTTSAIATSAAMSQNDTTPFGEILWNIDTSEHAYSLSQNDHYVLSASGDSLNSSSNPWVLTNSVMSKQQAVNMYDGVPLSNQYYGVNGVEALISTNTWNIYSGQIISGNNSAHLTGTDKYFKIVDYYPSAAEGGLKGTFKCKISGKLGSMKFNKLALYAVQVNESGTEIGSPVLFAEAMMKNPVIKTNFGTEGFDDIVIDVQISLSTITSAWDDVFYSTSGDYWERTPNGLYYPERIGIGSYHEGTLGPEAMLDIRSDSIHQLRLTYSDNIYSEIFTNSYGDLVLSASNQVSYSTHFSPLEDNKYSLGGGGPYDWKSIYVNSIRNRDLVVSAATLVPIDNEYYNLGSNISRWNTIFARQLDISTLINCGNIIPKANDTYILGQSGNVFKLLNVNTIQTDGTVNFNSDIDPSIDDRYEFGKTKKWKKINGTTGYFSNGIYEKGRTLKMGEWKDASWVKIHESTNPDHVDTSLWKRVKYTVIGNTVFMVGAFIINISSGQSALHLEILHNISDEVGLEGPWKRERITCLAATGELYDDVEMLLIDGDNTIIISKRTGNFTEGSTHFWFSIWFESPYYNE